MLGDKVRRLRKSAGFTLFEFFAVVIIVVILVGVALPYFFSARDLEAEATIKANMKIAQMAAESYAHDHAGEYPPEAADLVYQSYFPGGNRNVDNPSPGNYPVNPFTKQPQPPLAGKVKDPVQAKQSPPQLLGEPGAIYYNAIVGQSAQEDANPICNSYAIQGASRSGYALIDREDGPMSKHTLVLTNP